MTTELVGAIVIAENLYEMIALHDTWRGYATRTYTLVFGLAIIVAEVEQPKFVLHYCRFLEAWPSKGLFIFFVGILTLDTESSEVSLLNSATAFAAIALGALYFLLGLLCVRTYRDALRDTVSRGANPFPRTSDADTATKRGTSDDPFGAGPSAADSASGGSQPSWMDPGRDQ